MKVRADCIFWAIIGMCGILMVVVGLCAGCAGVLKNEQTAPRVLFESSDVTVYTDGRVVAKSVRSSAEGSGLTGATPEESQIPPTAAGPGGATTGKGGMMGQKPLADRSMVYWIGGAAMIGAALLWYFVGWRLGVAMAVAGLGFVAGVHFIEGIPPVVIVVPLLGAGVYLAIKHGWFRVAFGSVVGGVERFKTGLEGLLAGFPARGITDAKQQAMEVIDLLGGGIKAEAGTAAARTKAEVGKLKG